jgi:hypothetical protein
MCHQVLDRDGARCGVRVVQRTVGPTQDAHCAELGQPTRDRVVESELAFLEQREREYDRHWLAHRRDAEDRRALHRQPVVDVAGPGGVGMHDVAAVPDERHDARHVARHNCVARHGADARRPLLGPSVAGSRVRHRGGGTRRRFCAAVCVTGRHGAHVNERHAAVLIDPAEEYCSIRRGSFCRGNGRRLNRVGWRRLFQRERNT